MINRPETPLADHRINRDTFSYQPYYCEENIYLLCRDLASGGLRLQALFITSTSGACLFFNQTAAPPGKPMLWDYHVILLAGPPYRVFDFDTSLGFGVDAEEYLRRTFDPGAPPRVLPLFRLLDGREFLARFSTDRRHMRDGSGAWLQPPPSWDPPRGPAAASDHELPRYIAMDEPEPGVIVNLQELHSLIGGT